MKLTHTHIHLLYILTHYMIYIFHLNKCQTPHRGPLQQHRESEGDRQWMRMGENRFNNNKLACKPDWGLFFIENRLYHTHLPLCNYDSMKRLQTPDRLMFCVSRALKVFFTVTIPCVDFMRIIVIKVDNRRRQQPHSINVHLDFAFKSFNKNTIFKSLISVSYLAAAAQLSSARAFTILLCDNDIMHSKLNIIVTVLFGKWILNTLWNDKKMCHNECV